MNQFRDKVHWDLTRRRLSPRSFSNDRLIVRGSISIQRHCDQNQSTHTGLAVTYANYPEYYDQMAVCRPRPPFPHHDKCFLPQYGPHCQEQHTTILHVLILRTTLSPRNDSTLISFPPPTARTIALEYQGPSFLMRPLVYWCRGSIWQRPTLDGSDYGCWHRI